jgi:hypothetical protein
MKYFTSRKSNKLNCPKFGEKGTPNLLTLQIYYLKRLFVFTPCFKKCNCDFARVFSTS